MSSVKAETDPLIANVPNNASRGKNAVGVPQRRSVDVQLYCVWCCTLANECMRIEHRLSTHFRQIYLIILM